MISRLRAVHRALLTVLITGGSVTAVLLGAALARLLRRRERPWISGPYRLWGRWLTRALGTRTTVEGAPPAAPFLLVTNHLGYLDIPLLASLADCTFIAKAEIASWPVAGMLCRSVDTIFVDRESRRDVVRVGEQITRVLEEGRGVVLFAEATTSPGETVQPFKTSLLAPVARLGLPVHHATLSYRTDAGQPPARDSVCWWGETEFLPHFLGLLRLPKIYATVRFGANPIQDSDRKELAERLRGAMLETFIPVIDSETSCESTKP
ncbi:MAG: 1-acyl-sn-glycerol-3-phosphate acyltransferase [Acidobacteria bacterium]|nr:1-acyl-sn-glycerol-3-phosphate acyltransferase [Acidobacteriota bacterium]